MPVENKPLCLILGGGGHARVLIDSLLATGVVTPFAVLDPNPCLWQKALLGVPIPGGDELIPELMEKGATCFVVGLGGVGDNRPRRNLFEFGLAQGLLPIAVFHPSAVLSPSAQIGQGSVLLPTAVVNAGAVIGANVIVNSAAVVEHDSVVEDHAHVATGALLASAVRVGRGAHVGAGATVRQCVSIGEFSIVGAGAVVIKDVPAKTVVVGVPAHRVSETG